MAPMDISAHLDAVETYRTGYTQACLLPRNKYLLDYKPIF
jgi:hypothetical protein